MLLARNQHPLYPLNCSLYTVSCRRLPGTQSLHLPPLRTLSGTPPPRLTTTHRTLRPAGFGSKGYKVCCHCATLNNYIGAECCLPPHIQHTERKPELFWALCRRGENSFTVVLAETGDLGQNLVLLAGATRLRSNTPPLQQPPQRFHGAVPRRRAEDEGFYSRSCTAPLFSLSSFANGSELLIRCCSGERLRPEPAHRFSAM